MSTHSKQLSNKLFSDVGVAHPEQGSESFPSIVKPSEGSGSEGICVVNNEDEMRLALQSLRERGDEDPVVEEFVSGPSISIELIGDGTDVQPLVTTELEFDSTYDCKRVLAPTHIDSDIEKTFVEHSEMVAEALHLHGVMDVEAMVGSDGEAKLIEIDARLPSQTPTTVLHASGTNILEEVVRTYLDGLLSIKKRPTIKNACIYEHISYNENHLRYTGEHVMGEAGTLVLTDKFFGATEAIVSQSALQEWGAPFEATLIFRGNSMSEVLSKHEKCIERLLDSLPCEMIEDSSPPL